MKNNTVRLLCIAGIFTALVFVFTAYLQFPVHTGYTHVGDGFIYLAACLLPLPYAMGVGAVGALLADCLTGFAIWAPASVIIKALTVVFFNRKSEKTVTWRNILALIPAWVLCVGGYYLYEALITWNFISPLAGVVGNLVQAALSSVLFIAVGFAMDKLRFKSKVGLTLQ